ncbi:MAG: hypothetical protein RSA20_04465 [Oscillospiraceae bacterium]
MRPAVFWRDYGINAHNVYSWGQPMWISYHYIKEALRFQSPKVVVLDVYGIMYGNSAEQPKGIDEVNYRSSFSIDPSLNFLEMTQTVGDCGIDLKNPIDFLNPIRFHTAWKRLSEENFTKNPHKEYSYLKGYGIQDGVTKIEMADILSPVQPRMPYDTAVKYLDKIVELSKKEGFQLVFTMLPYQFRLDERELFAWVSDYAKEKNIPFLNYCEGDGQRIGFDYATDFSDRGHTNYKGAFKISEDMASFVSENYGALVTQPKPNAKQLDKDAQQVFRVLKVNEEVTENVTDYFAHLKADENSVVIANINPRDGAAVSPEFLKALDSLGISPTTPQITVAEGGKTAEYKDEFSYKGLTLTSNKEGNGILFHGEDYFPKENIDYKFCIYDKILERPTFYFYYYIEGDTLVIKDFPAK